LQVSKLVPTKRPLSSSSPPVQACDSSRHTEPAVARHDQP
jgi:hypothetical protein